MLKKERILALIPARGGSKGIKHKNRIPFCGKPLIQYSVDAARSSRMIDNILVSTDDPTIAEIAERLGAEVPFLRPAYLADDRARTIDVVIHALKYLKERNRYYDSLILLQPTQPLRTAMDIDGAVETFLRKGRQGLVSVSPVDDHPILIRTVDEQGKLTKLLSCQSTCRRQDMPVYYKVNGCIYINKVAEITSETSLNDNPIPYIMERSHSVDIDDWVDLHVAEYYLKKAESEE